MSGADDLEAALQALEELADATTRNRAPRAPDRYDARALLVPLGERLLAGEGAALEETLERARTAGDALGDAWRDAVRGELALAAAEHVHAVDRRYLDLPNYDFAYTVQARRRLEARLVAAAELDLELSDALREGIRQADEALAPYLEGRGRDKGTS